jgi:hypothetical protein
MRVLHSVVGKTNFGGGVFNMGKSACSNYYHLEMAEFLGGHIKNGFFSKYGDKNETKSCFRRKSPFFAVSWQLRFFASKWRRETSANRVCGGGWTGARMRADGGAARPWRRSHFYYCFWCVVSVCLSRDSVRKRALRNPRFFYLPALKAGILEEHSRA